MQLYGFNHYFLQENKKYQSVQQQQYILRKKKDHPQMYQMQSKRTKYANQIRRKQHQQYFQLNRQRNGSKLPALAYIPILLQNQLYDDLQNILDSIQYQTDQNLINPNLIQQIKSKSKYHSNPKVQLIMLQLLNRLGQWTQPDIIHAINILKQGNLTMLKQFSLYFQQKCQYLFQQNPPQLTRQQQLKKLTYFLKSVFQIIINFNNLQNQFKIYWLDLITRTLDHADGVVDQLVQQFDQLIPMFYADFNCINHECQTNRVLRIIHKLASFQKISPKIIQLPCFISLLKLIKNQSIQVIILALQTIAQLMSSNEDVISKLVNNFQIVQILITFINHILVPVQVRALWALSNIAGSQKYKTILQNEQLLYSLFKKTKQIQATHSIQRQLYFCIINLICNSNSIQLNQIINKYSTIQIILDILHYINQPNFKQAFFQRTIYAIYHLITQYHIAILQLEKLGVKSIISTLHHYQLNPTRLQMINSLLDSMDKISQNIQIKSSN